MEYGICMMATVPVRKEASDRSEMTTQLLFGERMRILEVNSNWLYIQTLSEDYPGWVDSKQIERISENEFDELNGKPGHYCCFPFGKMSIPGKGSSFLIPAGSSLPGLSENKFLKILSTDYEFSGESTDEKITDRNQVVQLALQFLDSPYLWGGKTLMGLDCSGFTQLVYRLNGIQLLRDASQQATQGLGVGFISEALPGDLAFFDNAEGLITHVGIVMEGNRIIHCSGKVRIDPIDHQGIYIEESKTYSHSLRLVRNVFAE
jgi:gamma-D-glutamyl-L-lysine dipeptidyl-peptidase